ncbi:hypothetical protein ACFVZS_30120, partial [Streptomyces abikoensis]
MATASLFAPRTGFEPHPTARYEFTAPATATTARVAREFVTAVLVAAERNPLIENARICVSDTVANVVQHARVPVLSVEVTVYGDRGGGLGAGTLDHRETGAAPPDTNGRRG